jgi:hypothetical protein
VRKSCSARSAASLESWLDVVLTALTDMIEALILLEIVMDKSVVWFLIVVGGALLILGPGLSGDCGGSGDCGYSAPRGN